MMRQTRGHLWLNTAEHGVSVSNIEAVFGGLIRASCSHISICAKHLNMWEARSIYLSLHFNCVSPENPGAQTAPETLAGGHAKHNSNVWAGETQSLPRTSTSSSCQPKAEVSLMGSTKQSGQLMMIRPEDLRREERDDVGY